MAPANMVDTCPPIEGELITWVSVVFMLPGIATSLGEARVEENASSTGGMGNDAIKDLALTFITVEIVLNKAAQETPTLRETKTVGVLKRFDADQTGWRVVTQKRYQITHCGEAKAAHLVFCCGVNELVNGPKMRTFSAGYFNSVCGKVTKT